MAFLDPEGGASAAPPTPRVITRPPSVPDYKTLLVANPAYQSYLNNANLSIGNAGAKRQAAIRALAIQYGGALPAGFKDAYGDLDQNTLDLAKQNQFSTLAGIGRNYDQSVLNDKRALAARGVLQSGELGYAMDRDNLSRGQAEYDAANAASAAMGGAAGDYLNAQTQAWSGLPGVINDVTNTLVKEYPASPEAGADLVPDWQSTYGVPVYKDGAGDLWQLDANGNPIKYTPPPTPPSAPQPSPYSGPTTLPTWSGQTALPTFKPSSALAALSRGRDQRLGF
jgi:hypothetical protein